MTKRMVVMGVSGTGKSTLARALAEELDARFVEGDALHPAANVARMAAGVPLTDADRLPFLERVAAALVEGGPVVCACSALKRRYRDLLRTRAGAIRFVLPLLDRTRLEVRLHERTAHFMPASLLDSQLAALELPDADEDAVLVDGTLSLPQQVALVIAAQVAARSAAA